MHVHHFVCIGLILILSVLTITNLYLWGGIREKPKLPSGCKGIKCKRISASRSSSSSMWEISWTPPSVGSGTGYTVSYTGGVTDSSGKSVYSFNDISQPGFSLPGDTPGGTYTVTVTAANQIGNGPPYSQTVTLQDQGPVLYGGDTIEITPNAVNDHYANVNITVKGNFPGWTSGNPPSDYTVSQALSANGQPIVPSGTQWNASGSSLICKQLVEAADCSPGNKLVFDFKICRFGLCVNNSDVFTVSGTAPGKSSDIRATFQN